MVEITETEGLFRETLGGQSDPRVGERYWLRAETLRRLRWFAVIGQMATVLITDLVLGFELPLLACIAAILASVWFNVAALLSMPPNARLSERAALAWLLFDMGQLALLLALTGGISNPFSLLFIAPATVAAAALSPPRAWIAVGVAFALILLIELFHIPLRHSEGLLELPSTYHFGVASALLIGMTFIAIYVRRVANEALGMSQALAATQLALAREQRLSSLGAMAAAAAHELGTPLSTIALTARELLNEAEPDSPLSDDLELIRAETRRCRDILAQLSSLRRGDTEHLTTAPLLSVLEEAAAPHAMSGKRIVYCVGGAEVGNRAVPSPLIHRKPEIIHALRNLVQNAVDFARSEVRISITESTVRIGVRIEDDGPGYAADKLPRLGDPFVTTRRGRRARETGYEGMGLGIFIAKTLLERSGASIAFSNQRKTSSTLPGALVEISWQRAALLDEGSASPPRF